MTTNPPMSVESAIGTETARGVLSRHPIAVDCALAAAGFAGGVCDIVVFESGRAFRVATTESSSLQPRHLLAAEEMLLASGDAIVSVGGDTAVAVSDRGGNIVGALTLPGLAEPVDLKAFGALARMVSTVLAAETGRESLEAVPEAVLDGLRDVVVLIDSELTIKWVNRAVGSLFGRSPADVIGRSGDELLHPDDVQIALDAITRLNQGLEIYRPIVRIEHGNGSYVQVEITGTDHSTHPVLQGTVMSLRVAAVDAELEASVERMALMSEAIVSGLHDGIVATDEFGAITMVNDTARAMFDLDPVAPAATLAQQDFALFDADGRPLMSDWTATFSGSQETHDREVCLISSRGDLRYVTTHIRSVSGAEGQLMGAVAVFHDVTDVRQAAEELRSQALHDQLTGLANRRQLEERLSTLADVNPPANVAACFIDLDGFKLVNDTHGHKVGDELILLAAKRLQTALRDQDLLVRHGGDEFVALLVGVDGADEAVDTADRLRRRLARPYSIGHDRFDLTASIGVALSLTHELGDDTLLRDADIALYAAKARGRNQVVQFDGRLAAAVELEEHQRRMLRDALDDDRLVMHFQPLIQTDTGVTVGYEALARCRTESGSLVGPSVFMDSISNSGLMWDLDQAAFALSCQAAAVLIRVAAERPPTIACNFSAVSLVQPDLINYILQTVSDNNVEPSQICIEITESSAFDAGPRSLEAIRTLHGKGFLIALDDFGTGYSSLAHLRDLPLTAVKVDRSFIAKLNRPSAERSIAEAIVNLATNLGLEVVAEGVESAEQLQHARRLGFTAVQGWHLSPALSLTDVLTTWLTRPTAEVEKTLDLG